MEERLDKRVRKEFYPPPKIEDVEENAEGVLEGCGDPKRLLDVPPNVGFPPKILDPLVLTEVDRLEPPNKDFV